VKKILSHEKHLHHGGAEWQRCVSGEISSLREIAADFGLPLQNAEQKPANRSANIWHS